MARASEDRDKVSRVDVTEVEITRHSLRFMFGAPMRRWIVPFWSWWISELAAMLPESMRRTLFSGSQRLFLELDGTDVVVNRGTAHASEKIARYPLGSANTNPANPPGVDKLTGSVHELVLCLPGDKALTKKITLPLATEENLREVLSFEMDRQTPFTSDQIYYDFTVVARDSRAHTLTVDLVVAPRRVVDDLLTGLAGIGLLPDLVTTKCNEGEEPASVNLMPSQNRRHKKITPHFVNVALGALAIALLITAVALPLLNKRYLIQSLEPLLETAANKAEVAHQLREKVDQLTSESRFLVGKKQSSLSTLQILDEITRILPDDTWINRLEIKGPEIQIHGQSMSAAALIPLIESSQSLHDARFRSPVTKLPRADIERFHLSARIREKTE
jgi:general secretion pathway protein L